MTTPLDIATTAATAVVGTMATAAWTQIREKCATLFQRYLDGADQTAALTRLDTHEQSMNVSDQRGREALRGVCTEAIAQDLAEILRRSPEAADQLRALAQAARAAAPEPAVSANDVRVKNVRNQGGDVIISGGDAHVGRDR
ncbi:hypothetical protein [Nocardiopsis sp. YSL2]|uniref:hypothetical protein n=1 Tax=Nocardiopsis sp. YSL2 TaxID=2939492 RepID=UPI0026F4574D|nr:hypothetical protein [Nocardiopsis sp. YSL2]